MLGEDSRAVLWIRSHPGGWGAHLSVRLQARDVEPSSSPPGVDELLGRETRPRTQVREVTFHRARPDTDELGGILNRSSIQPG
jgi:hypothetical protein